MTMTYRTAGSWGAGKGGNLTPAEVDGNFWDLDQRVVDLVAGMAPVEIVSVALSGSQLTFTLSDSTTLGPVTVPRARIAWRGDWIAATDYYRNDLVRIVGEGLYLVAEDHTSPAVWDDAHTVGGNDAYVLMFAEPRASVVTVADATHTPSSVYAYHRYTNLSGCAVTIPANATNALPVGTEFHLCQRGGALTIAGDTGVTVNIPDGLTPATDRLGAVVTIKKVSADEWDAFGLMAVV